LMRGLAHKTGVNVTARAATSLQNAKEPIPDVLDLVIPLPFLILYPYLPL